MRVAGRVRPGTVFSCVCGRVWDGNWGTHPRWTALVSLSNDGVSQQDQCLMSFPLKLTRPTACIPTEKDWSFLCALSMRSAIFHASMRQCHRGRLGTTHKSDGSTIRVVFLKPNWLGWVSACPCPSMAHFFESRHKMFYNWCEKIFF